MQVIGISNEPKDVIKDFVKDQGITFPVLHDADGTYFEYNIPGGISPYPRDFIIDENGIVLLAKTEYEPGVMINLIEKLLPVAKVSTESDGTFPHQIHLSQNYPNPFNSTTSINFSLDKETTISLSIYDINGRVQSTLFTNEKFSPGVHTVALNFNNLPTGIYFIKLKTPKTIQTRKVAFLK